MKFEGVAGSSRPGERNLSANSVQRDRLKYFIDPRSECVFIQRHKPEITDENPPLKSFRKSSLLPRDDAHRERRASL